MSKKFALFPLPTFKRPYVMLDKTALIAMGGYKPPPVAPVVPGAEEPQTPPAPVVPVEPGANEPKVAVNLKTLLKVIFTGRFLNSVVGDLNKSWTIADSVVVSLLSALSFSLLSLSLSLSLSHTQCVDFFF